MFPIGHPKAGQPTYFVEKFWNSIDKILSFDQIKHLPCQDYGKLNDFIPLNLNLMLEKHHTLRVGSRWKVGDKFSPRVWSGKPYNSKQIIIAPDIEIVKLWNVVIESTPNQTLVMERTESHTSFNLLSLGEVATNDGLSIEDFVSWFNPNRKNIELSCQIICWNPIVNY